MNSKTAKGLKITGLVLAVVVLIALASLFGVFAHKSTLLAADLDRIGTAVGYPGDDAEDDLLVYTEKYVAAVLSESSMWKQRAEAAQTELDNIKTTLDDLREKYGIQSDEYETLSAYAEALNAELQAYKDYASALEAWISDMPSLSANNVAEFFAQFSEWLGNRPVINGEAQNLPLTPDTGLIVPVPTDDIDD